MLTKILLILIFSSIFCDDIKNITIIDEKIIEETIPETDKPILYRIKYGKSKTYIHIKVISETDNPYISYCTTIDCPNTQILLSNLRENEQHLFIQSSLIPEDTNEGYIYINTYNSSLKGKVYFLSQEYIELNRGASLSYYHYDDSGKDIIRIPADNTNNLISLSLYSPNYQFYNFQIFYCDDNGCNDEIKYFNMQYGFVTLFKESDYQPIPEYSYYQIEFEVTNHVFYVINCNIFSNGQTEYLANSLAFTGYIIKELLDTQCFNIKVKEENEEQQINVHLMSFYKSFSYNTDDSQQYSPIDYDKTFHLKRKNQKICIKSENISVYFLEVIDLNEVSNSNKNYYTPQINGYIYNRMTSPKKIVYFNYGKEDIEDLKVSFYLKVKKGKPVLYHAMCNTYPNCIYEFDNIKSYIADKIFKETNLINNIYIINFDVDPQIKITSNKQNLYAVACFGDEECEYESLISSFNGDIILKADERFINYLNKDGYYDFNYNNTDEKVTSLIFTVYTFSGDINVRCLEYEYLKKPVYLNKQEFIYNIEHPNDTYNLVGNYITTIYANNDSFFSLEMTIIKDNTQNEEKTINLIGGATYIETLALNEENKYILKLLQNKNLNANVYVSFFALNCKVTINKITNPKELIKSGYFTRDEVVPGDTEFEQRFIDYKIKAEEMDSVRTAESEPCMVYITSIENNFKKSSFTLDDRYLIIAQNIQYASILTDKTKGIKYLFPISSNYEGEILLQIEAINQPEFNIYYYYYEENENKYDNLKTPITITTSTSLILEKPIKHIQKRNSIIKMFIEITANDESLKKHIEFSFSIRQEIISPSYIKKGLMKTDIIAGKSSVYYYTDVNKGEEGEVLVNFERGTGNIYARIVSKENDDLDSNWMGRVHLPNANDDDLLTVNEYSHKILYDADNTKICGNIGCFLLITIENTVSRTIESNDYLYDISLYAKVNNGDKFKNQIINIVLDRFIIGDFPSNKDITYKQYYTFRLPNDAEKIVFELQSDLVNLFVSPGKSIPEPATAQFQFKSNGKPNSVFKIEGESVKEYLKKNSWFTITVALQNYDKVIENLFSLRIRAPPKGRIDLIPLNSDQNTLCDFDGTNFCYFLKYVKSNEQLRNLFVHVFQDKQSKFEIYARNLSASELNIKENLPNPDNAYFSSMKQFMTDNLLMGLDEVTLPYLVIAVRADKKGIITLLSTLYTYAEQLNIDPSAYTLFHLYTEDAIKLNFPNNNMYIAHFVSITGYGKIITNDTNDEYLLKGSNDILGMIMPIATSREITVNSVEGELGFYVYIEPRTIINYDEIEYGTSGEIFYDDSSFPIIYYVEVPEDYYDVVITINLKNFTLLNNTINDKDDDIIVDDLSLEFKGYVTSRSFIIKKKADHDVNPRIDELNIDGQFDYTLKIAKIFFSRKDIDNAKIDEKKYLYVTLSNKKKEQYSGIKTEYAVIPLSSDIYVAPYNQYIFGSLKNENDSMAIYKIRKNYEYDKFMRFEFSSNGEEKIKVFFLEKLPKKGTVPPKSDINVEEQKKKNGKKIFIVELKTIEKKEIDEFYFVAYSNDNSLNFVFKYYSTQEKKFPNYELKNEISVIINSNNSLSLKFEAINKLVDNDKSFVPATFIATVVDQFEVFPDFGSICFNNEKVYKVYKKEYKNISDKDITMKLNDFPNDKAYNLIVSAITNEDYSEIFYYNVLKNPLKYSPPLSSGTKLAIILLVVFIVVLICVFGYIFFKMRKDHQRFNDKINRMSGYNIVSEEPENLNYHKAD